MRSRTTFLSAALIALVAVAAAMFAKETWLMSRPRAKFALPEFELAAADGDAASVKRSEAELALIVKRLKPAASAAKPEPVVERTAPVKAPTNLKIRGTIVGSGQSFAIVAFPDGKQELVPEGGVAGTTKVKKVTATFVELETQGAVSRVYMYEEADGGRR